MLDQAFRRTVVRERISTNPIGPILQRYTSFLSARGHRRSPLHQYVFAAEHYGNWLGGRSIDLTSVERFIKRHLPRCRCPKPAPCRIATVRAALNRLLEMLGRASPEAADPPWEIRLLTRYEEHLSGNCGLAPSTIQYRLRYARSLLRQLQLRGLRQLLATSPQKIARYVSTSGQRCKPSSGQVIASSARSFLRFSLHGLISRDLGRRRPFVRKLEAGFSAETVSRTVLDKMVNSIDEWTPLGRRDRAVVLCMTELGLRAADMASLRLGGVDLIGGILRLRSPKQRNDVERPMTRPLAVAIRDHLDRGRPTCQTASLFVLHRAPFGAPLEPLAIRGIVRRHAAEAGLRDRFPGTHVIRHSVATQLINAGASLKQIADLPALRPIH